MSSAPVAVLTDFGSTYTKVTLVELVTGALVAHAEAPTTVTTDVIGGFRRALAQAVEAAPQGVTLGPRISASSAGGGLRIAAVGLVAELTTAAARHAALNAGGRVELVLSGSLAAREAAALRAARPDIVLFCGGTDGGQRDRVVHNAEVVTASGAAAEVVVACNREIAEEVAARFRHAGFRTQIVENTMPRLGELNIGPAREAILRAFLDHVIRDKRLSLSREFTDSVVTSTPNAVLRGTELLASGTGAHPRTASVAVVDVGGATTDVHSCVDPNAAHGAGTSTPLLPVPAAVRTVQGDLGMRASAGGVLAADRGWLERLLGDDLGPGVEARETQIGLLPDNEPDAEVDRALATSCVTHALRRHCGRHYWALRQNELARAVQTGPDLREVELLVGTGGVLTHGRHGTEVVEHALARIREDHSLMAPVAPRLVIDHHYILAAAGLLAMHDPALAGRFLARQMAGEPESVRRPRGAQTGVSTTIGA